MKKIFFLFFLILTIPLHGQKFGYVNSEFILSSMKEYKEAISEIENLSKAWEKEINTMYIEIEKKEIELKAEEILLTKEMFEDRREKLDEECVEQLRKTFHKRARDDDTSLSSLCKDFISAILYRSICLGSYVGLILP